MKKNRLINFTATLSLVITASHLSGQCTVPGSVTATPSMVCPGSTRSLSAVSPGNSIMWWNSPTLGIPYGSSPSGGNFTVAPVNSTTYYAEAYAPPVAGGSLSLAYTGEIQLIEIPAGVNQVTIDAMGAQGGYDTPANGGLGAKMSGVFAVTPGQKLFVLVGQSPGDISIGGYYYPGGGGGSYVGTGLSLATCSPMIVAGGGGAGLGTPGDNAPVTNNGTGPNPGMNGMGAPSNTCGGGGGGFYSDGGSDITYNYAGGQGFVNGGAGGTATVSGYQPGGFGGGAPADYWGLCNLQAGAGGGYGGGSGYNSQNYFTSGAAGGSFNNGTNQSNSPGFQSGDGQITIYGISSGSCVSVSRSPVTVSVTPSPTVNISGGPAGICPGTTVNLTASGANTFSWNTGATSSTIAPTPTASTTYTVWGNSGGCTVSAVFNVTVYPAPGPITGNTLICGEGGTVVLTAGNADTYSWSNGAITQTISVSPTVTSVYSVVETNTLGFCSNNFSTSVMVSSSPTVSISAGSGEICAGAAVNLTGSGATSYSWSTGGLTSTIAPTPSVNTTYTLLGANPPSQCIGSAVITITVDPTPVIFTSGSGTICGGQLNALGVQGAYTYTWQPGNLNGFIINVAPNVTTTYTVVGTSMAGCLSNTTTATIDVRNCTGIKENSQALNGLLIYPNPTSGEFSVELSNGLTKLVEITDLTGRVVFRGSEQGDKFNINIARLDNGIYYVKVQSDNASSVFKITKQ